MPNGWYSTIVKKTSEKFHVRKKYMCHLLKAKQTDINRKW